MLKQVALVRLVPAHLHRRNGTEVETIHIGRSEEFAYQQGIRGDRRHYKTGSQGFRDLFLSNRNNARKRKQKLSVGQGMVGRVTKHNGWQEIGTTLPRDQPLSL